MAKLKVFGVNYDGKHRRIVAAPSQKVAAELVGISVSHMRNYGSQTWNDEEISLAMEKPSVVFEQSFSKHNAPWRQVN